MAPVVLVQVMQEVSVVRWPGHNNAGMRAPDAITVAHGVVTIAGSQDGTMPAALSLAPGDPATGRPSDYPQRAPRRLG